MKLQHNIPLAGYTSLHAGGSAQALIATEEGDELKEIIASAEKPIWVLGYGTNTLISDRGLPGTVIFNQTGRIEISEGGQIRADSGANWDDLIQKAIESNLWGLEFTSGIPGGVGAAIVGNIAAYGHKISDRFIKATFLNTSDGSVFEWENSKLGFSYRSSDLQKPENRNLVILDAAFQLSPEPTGELEYESALKSASELNVPPDSLANRRKVIIETRRKAGSLLANPAAGPYTAGSFFKNPLVGEDQIQNIIAHEETGINREQLLRQNVVHSGNKSRVSAAHVLLAAGFKQGQTWGNVRLHPNHILKVENIGSASAQEIYDVVHHIIATVHQRLNIQLEPEVRFLGEF